MSLARELYPDSFSGFSEICDYYPILNHIGHIVIKVDDDDCQGDSRVLYQNGNRIGWLQFGWGSCSGCDALMACSTVDEVEELIAELTSEVKWFESASEALEFFRTHD